MRTLPAAASLLVLLLGLPACGGGQIAASLVERLPDNSVILGESAPVETGLDDPDIAAAWRVWLAMIGAARERIDVAQFYVANAPDSHLEAVIQALEAAAARGVQIRLLVEDKLCHTYPETVDRLARSEGISVRRWRAAETLGGILHAKYFLVDGVEAWLGSQNFDWRSLSHIQELGVRVRAPATVKALAGIFAVDWALAGGAKGQAAMVDLPQAATETVGFHGAPTRLRLVASPKGYLPHRGSWDLPALVDLLDGAKRRVRIQLMSLHLADKEGRRIPEIEAALRRAAARGVKVELLLAHWTRRKSHIGDARTLQRIPGIEVRLLEVPLAKAGFMPFARVIHAKYLVADGRTAWLGTSNWGWGYFHDSRNVGVVARGEAFAGALDRFFERGWHDPGATPLDPDADYPVPRIYR